MDRQGRKFVEETLYGIFSDMGIEQPENFEKIAKYIMADVSEAADKDFSSEDIAIAFRRWIESRK